METPFFLFFGKGDDLFRSEVLEAVLTPEQRQRGFELAEEEGFINLLYKGKVVAVFSSKGATIAEIRQTADRIIQKNN